MHHDTDLINIIAVGLALECVLGAFAHEAAPVAAGARWPCSPASSSACSRLGFVADQELANQLSELGVMLLMFGVGLHFSLEDLLEVGGGSRSSAPSRRSRPPPAQGAGLGHGLDAATAGVIWRCRWPAPVLLRAMEDRRSSWKPKVSHCNSSSILMIYFK